MKLIDRTLILFAMLGVGVTQLRSQTASQCAVGTVDYRAPIKELDGKIELRKAGLAIDPPAGGRRVPSPQGTAWFIEVDPNYMTTKIPWKTTLYFGGLGHTGVFVQATFKDHGNTFTANWINEKLVFIQVWWGRMASSDLILDVSKGEFIYNEFAHYDDLFAPCGGSPPR